MEGFEFGICRIKTVMDIVLGMNDYCSFQTRFTIVLRFRQIHFLPSSSMNDSLLNSDSASLMMYLN